jgi:hypothetical protein
MRRLLVRRSPEYVAGLSRGAAAPRAHGSKGSGYRLEQWQDPRMAEPPSDARQYAYEMPPKPGAAPGGSGGGFVFRPEPLIVGDRLTIGVPPDERHWEVVRIEQAPEDGEFLRVPLSGPPGWPRQSDAIWGGRLTLHRLP